MIGAVGGSLVSVLCACVSETVLFSDLFPVLPGMTVAAG